MEKKQISLKQLQAAVSKERSKAKTAEERRKLERELKELRAGQSTKILKRLGRGFVVLSKKTGKAAAAGAKVVQKFGEERGAEGFFDTDISGRNKVQPKRTVRRATKRKRVKRVVRRTSVRPKTRQVFVQGLGLVTQKVKSRKRTVRKRTKRRPQRRRRRRVFQEQDNGFLSGLPQVGI